MAKASSSAQHYLECDNCEKNPAKFLCKTCTGHLCEPCKSKHERKKITRYHEILSLNSNSKNEELLDIILCPIHAKKTLECYCDRCKEPVCTECILQSHNGHSVKSLITVYKEFRDYSKQKKSQIENVLLPCHKTLLAEEKEKRSALIQRADEIEKKIDAHTQSVIGIVTLFGKQTVASLQKAKMEGLKEMDDFNKLLEEKINKLHQLSKELSTKLEAKPQISIFKSNNSDDLKSFETLPYPIEHNLTDFQPQTLDVKKMFGKPPGLESGNGQTERSFVSFNFLK